MPGARGIRKLLRALYAPEAEDRWEAVRRLGEHAEAMAAEKPEAVRELVRRFVWSMSEEAGASPWGAPEAMGEILRRLPALRRDFAGLYAGYLSHEDMVLDHALLDAGALWAVGTLAEALPDPAVFGRILPRFLRAPSPEVRGMAARAARRLGIAGLLDGCPGLAEDRAEVPLLEDGVLVRRTVAELAAGGGGEATR